MPVIVTEQLTRTFGDRTAVDTLSIEISTGEVFGLLGHNGAGKTTTLRLVNGILSPTDGRVEVFGVDPYLEGSTVRSRTGVLTESPALDGQLTVVENLRMYGAINGLSRDEIDRATDGTLQRLSLEAFASTQAGQLSAGLKQRVALARALLHDPELLLLDEPTSSLDPVAARQVRDLIRELSDGGQRTVVLCTHNLMEAQELCDRVAILQRGHVIAQGTPADLAERLGGGTTVSIVLDRAPDEDVMQELRGVPGVSSATDGSGSVLIEQLDAQATPVAVETLVRHGYRIYRVDDTRASLEDIYLQLHAEEVAPSPAGE